MTAARTERNGKRGYSIIIFALELVSLTWTLLAFHVTLTTFNVYREHRSFRTDAMGNKYSSISQEMNFSHICRLQRGGLPISISYPNPCTAGPSPVGDPSSQTRSRDAWLLSQTNKLRVYHLPFVTLLPADKYTHPPATTPDKY